MRVLIFGGTGFAGQALIAHLGRASPAPQLCVVSRAARDLPGVARVIRGHYADLAGAADFRRDLAGFDAVVHLGDGLGPLQDAPASADLAVAQPLIEASERLVVAIRDARVPLLVYISSLKAICDEEDQRLLVETSAPAATTLYGRAKLAMETAVARHLTGSSTTPVIVRNPVTYGAGKLGSLTRLLQLAATPFPLPLGGIANRRSVLAVDNLASALGAILEAGASAPGGVFHVHDGPAPSTTEIVEIFRAALGRPRRLFAIGAAAQRALCHAPGIGPIARRLYGSLELTDARFRQAFAWTPVVEGKAALAAMARATAGTAQESAAAGSASGRAMPRDL